MENTDKWVESGIAIKNGEKCLRDDIVLADYHMGTVVSEMDICDDSGNELKTIPENICIGNGLVLPKDMNHLSFDIETPIERHEMYCEPIRNVPGLYKVTDSIVDKTTENSSEGPIVHDSAYYVSIDARYLARALEIPQKELVVTQETLIGEDNQILQVVDVPEDAKWYCAGCEIKDLEQVSNENGEIIVDSFDFSGFAKRTSLEKPEDFRNAWVHNGLVLPESKDELLIVVEGSELNHQIHCEPVKGVPGLYHAIDTISDNINPMEPERDVEYYVAIDAQRLAKCLGIPKEDIMPVKEVLVSKDNHVICRGNADNILKETKSKKASLKPKAKKVENENKIDGRE